jgi:hypothetical protein
MFDIMNFYIQVCYVPVELLVSEDEYDEESEEEEEEYEEVTEVSVFQTNDLLPFFFLFYVAEPILQ